MCVKHEMGLFVFSPFSLEFLLAHLAAILTLLIIFQEDPRKIALHRGGSLRGHESPSPLFRSNSSDDLLHNLGPLPVRNQFYSFLASKQLL